MIKFNQNAWLKPYIDTNTDLRKKAKNDSEKDFLSWQIMQFLGKLWEMWEKRDIELVITERRNYLVSEPNYHIKNSNYELHRPLPKWKNEKVIGLMKDELIG